MYEILQAYLDFLDPLLRLNQASRFMLRQKYIMHLTPIENNSLEYKSFERLRIQFYKINSPSILHTRQNISVPQLLP